MRLNYPLHSQAVTLMLVTYGLVVLPHFFRINPWVVLFIGLCVLWRGAIQLGRARHSRAWQRFLLGALGVALVYSRHNSLVGLAPGVDLLLIAYSLKLLEIYTHRDSYVFVILSYFVLATQFFFDTDLWNAGYVLVALVAITATLIAIHQVRKQPLVKTLGLSAQLLLYSAPVMLLFFFMFPRLAPFWQIDVARAPQTGISDKVSPGDISALSRSSELAFRAQFNANNPLPAQLYWRGLTLNHFDGRAWQPNYQGFSGAQGAAELNQLWLNRDAPWRLAEQANAAFSYRIDLQPTQQNWLFSLGVPNTEQRQIQWIFDNTLQRREPIRELFSYAVDSYPLSMQRSELPAPLRELYLQLPDKTNPQARIFVEQLQRLHTRGEDLAQALLNWFNQEPFFYTTRPPALGDNYIDEFLFGSRRGFCEHYASAFVFMLRSAGIPARLVVGYQGGEYNQLGNYWLVHQFDAHAWAELWLPGRGWVMFDPTAAVAPSRIETGLSAAIGAEETFLADSPLALVRYQQNDWLMQLRLRLDYLAYAWDRWVLGYDQRQQVAWFSRLFDEVTPTKIALLLIGVAVVCFVLLGLLVLSGRRAEPLDAMTGAFVRATKAYAAIGLARNKGETLSQYCQRMAVHFPHQPDAWRAVAKAYEQSLYRRGGFSQAELRHFKQLLRRLPRPRRGFSLLPKALTDPEPRARRL